ncbi:hypothetical protein GQ54DRAFT_125769 [Martensiomyces pterosporus]|nr:hypothetical protein GQ54DRAFT_125769 [Martensiomyces pterosporus]
MGGMDGDQDRRHARSTTAAPAIYGVKSGASVEQRSSSLHGGNCESDTHTHTHTHTHTECKPPSALLMQWTIAWVFPWPCNRGECHARNMRNKRWEQGGNIMQKTRVRRKAPVFACAHLAKDQTSQTCPRLLARLHVCLCVYLGSKKAQGPAWARTHPRACIRMAWAWPWRCVRFHLSGSRQ